MRSKQDRRALPSSRAPSRRALLVLVAALATGCRDEAARPAGAAAATASSVAAGAGDTVLVDGPPGLAPLAFAEQYRQAGLVASAAWREGRVPAGASVVGVRIGSGGTPAPGSESRLTTYYFTRAQLDGQDSLVRQGRITVDTVVR